MSVELGVFILVYMGMMLGRFPGLALDRTGIALLGAIALVASGRVEPRDAWAAVDVGTIGLLLGLMVVSGQFQLGGVYGLVTQRMAQAGGSPQALLALVIGVAALLSALLVNDVVCLAVAPLLIEICARRGLAPVPYLLALACASNVGSAATIIGNPQNMLIGQTLHLSFAGYLLDSVVPSVLGLGVIWLILRRRVREPWPVATPVPPAVAAPPLDAGHAAKGVAAILVLVGLFLFAPWPREVMALSAAGLLMISRTMHSRRMLELVDWPLLVLFAGLFIVNHALDASGMLARLTQAAGNAGIDLHQPATLFVSAVVLSNLVSNVPAVMLLLPTSDHPFAGPILALASTLAGNLILVGSIANLIVVDQAARLGVHISWRDHARVGVPVTLGTLAIAAAWLWLRARGGA